MLFFIINKQVFFFWFLSATFQSSMACEHVERRTTLGVDFPPFCTRERTYDFLFAFLFRKVYSKMSRALSEGQQDQSFSPGPIIIKLPPLTVYSLPARIRILLFLIKLPGILNHIFSTIC